MKRALARAGLEAESFLLPLLEAVPAGVVVADSGGRIVLVNSRIEGIFGHAPEALIGKTVELLIPRDKRNAHARSRRAYAASPKTREMGRGRGICGLRKDGKVIPIEVGLSSIRPNGRTLSMATIIDITDRKRAEDALRASEQKYRRFIETTQEAFAEIDKNKRLVSFNDRLCRMFGYSKSELLGWKVLDRLVSPEDRESLANHLRNRWRGESDSFVQRYSKKNGEHIWLMVSGTPIFNEKGAIQGAFAMMTDITARKHAEDALRASESRYRRFIETTHEAFGEIDAAGRMVSFNERMNQMFGYRGNQLLGLNIVDGLVSPEDRETLVNQLRKRKRGQADSYAQRFVKKNGEHIWAMVTGTPILNDAGEVRGSFAMMTDITDRVRAREAEEKVARALACKEILADISHELRTPIATLRIAAETLLRRGISGSKDDALILKTIAHQTERLSKLVSNLIQLAGRDFTSPAAPPTERFSLSGLVGGCLRDHSFLAKEKRLVLRGRVEPGINIRGNRDELRQAVENLIDNAIQYNRPGGKVEVALRAAAGRFISGFATPGSASIRRTPRRCSRAFAARAGPGG